MNPVVSVIMPAYNGEKYIRDAIKSVLAQSYPYWELIIVEDCSKDNTVGIIKEFNDERIKLYINDRNRGIVYSTNRGIDSSIGKYIALLDDDDVALERRFEWQVEYLEAHLDVDVLGGWNGLIDENGDFIGYDREPVKNPKLIKTFLLFYKKMFTDCTVMYRKEFIDKNAIRYRDGYLGMHDLRFYMECSKVGNITAIDRFLINKRIHPLQETQMQLRENGKARAEAFARLQCESIEMSGFRLSEDSLRIINEVMTENVKEKYSADELRALYSVFKEMTIQAKEMDIDYYKEFEFGLKKILGDRILPRTEIF